MKTVAETLTETKAVLRSAGIETWGIDSDLIMMQAMDFTRIQLVTRDDEIVSGLQQQRLDLLLEKRLKGMPMQYILGHCEFMGIEFNVNENVLIPRPDTEVLVEEILAIKKDNMLDLCTGSGAIAIACAKYGVKNVTAADISEAALNVARLNAVANCVDVTFVKSDLFKNINSKFDIIASNPPYIESDVIPTLDRQVKDFEPHLALDGGVDGLDFYRKIVEQSVAYLNKNGVLAFEIGYNQGIAVSDLMANTGFYDVKIIKDLAGLDRVVTGVLR